MTARSSRRCRRCSARACALRARPTSSAACQTMGGGTRGPLPSPSLAHGQPRLYRTRPRLVGPRNGAAATTARIGAPLTERLRGSGRRLQRGRRVLVAPRQMLRRLSSAVVVSCRRAGRSTGAAAATTLIGVPLMARRRGSGRRQARLRRMLQRLCRTLSASCRRAGRSSGVAAATSHTGARTMVQRLGLDRPAWLMSCECRARQLQRAIACHPDFLSQRRGQGGSPPMVTLRSAAAKPDSALSLRLSAWAFLHSVFVYILHYPSSSSSHHLHKPSSWRLFISKTYARASRMLCTHAHARNYNLLLEALMVGQRRVRWPGTPSHGRFKRRTQAAASPSPSPLAPRLSRTHTLSLSLTLNAVSSGLAPLRLSLSLSLAHERSAGSAPHGACAAAAAAAPALACAPAAAACSATSSSPRR